jgi:hypothetical protein
MWRKHKYHLNLLLLVLGISMASVTTARFAHAEKDSVAQQQNISGARNSVETGKSINLPGNKARNFAERNELQVKAIKENPKTNRIIILLVIISVIALIYFNFMAIGDNARYCTSCGYSGTMKAIKLSDNPASNNIIKLLVGILPILLYLFSTKGRFICPQCQRSSTNKSIKSSIKDVQK